MIMGNKFEEGLDWGLFLADYDRPEEDQEQRDDQSDDRRNSIAQVVELLENARSVDKTTVPIAAVRAALVKGWYDRTRTGADDRVVEFEAPEPVV